MDPFNWALVAMFMVIVLLVLGMPIAFVSALLGLGGMIILRGFGPAAGLTGGMPWSETAQYTFIVIPFFLMMGYFAHYGGIVGDVYESAKRWFGHLPGGLAIATNWGVAVWSAISGSSAATCAIMGRIAVPEMLKYGYDRRLACGAVAAGAAMDALIPPSAVMVFYGILTDTSIGRLLIAGFIPGFLEALTFAVLIYTMVRRNPALAPPAPAASWSERVGCLTMIGNWALVIIFIAVFGGIYTGVFTPTEAAGIGAFGCFLTALLLRRLNWQNLKEGMLATGRTTVMIFILIAGILIFSHFLAFSGFTKRMTDLVLSFPVPPIVILLGFLGIYLILGCFLEAIGMMALTLPLFAPIAEALGFNMIWFGILVVKMIEIAFITPPVGLNVYVLKATLPEVPTAEIFRGVMPFLIVQFINVIIILNFPQIVLVLPNMMMGK